MNEKKEEGLLHKSIEKKIKKARYTPPSKDVKESKFEKISFLTAWMLAIAIIIGLVASVYKIFS